MFEKSLIIELSQKRLKAFDGFIVDVIITPGNKILVEIDSPRGISINECADLNRFLNTELDNETNEFELTVSSPGMEKPFKVLEQYHKNIGREVKIKTLDKKELNAVLKEVTSKGIHIVQKVKETKEGKKKPEWVEKEIFIDFENIKETKKVVTFK